MNIVLAGAGEVGLNLAKSLAHQNHNISIIDYDKEHLDIIASKVDVLTVHGNASSIEVLKNAKIESADIFMAITSLEQTNLLSAIIAKRLGAKRTFARVSNPEFLSEDQKVNFSGLGVDKIFSPRILAVKEIGRLLQRVAFSDVYEFEGGKIYSVGFKVDKTSIINNKSLIEIAQRVCDFPLRVMTVLRKDKTIIPSGDFVVNEGDQIYLSVLSKDLKRVNRLVGKKLKKIKKVMIVGGTALALSTAKKLEQQYNVTLMINSRQKARAAIDELEHTLVIDGDPSDIELLKDEGIEGMDAFIALTDKPETNIISSLLAEELGVFKTIALVDNTEYIRLSQHIGIDTFINKQDIAADYIYQFIRQGKVQAISSMHGTEAETIEYEVQENNSVTRAPIKELDLANRFIIAGAIRDGNAIIPDGDFQILTGDKIIIMVHKEQIPFVEGIFS